MADLAIGFEGLITGPTRRDRLGIHVLRRSSGIEILPYLLNFQCRGFPMHIMASGTQMNGRAGAQRSFNDRHGHSGEQFLGAQGTTHREANL
jgi:hypothetical protein